MRIKQFYGASENTVKRQIWIAVAAYSLVAIARKWLVLAKGSLKSVKTISIFFVNYFDPQMQL